MSWFVPEPSHHQPVVGGADDLGPAASPIIDRAVPPFPSSALPLRSPSSPDDLDPERAVDRLPSPSPPRPSHPASSSDRLHPAIAPSYPATSDPSERRLPSSSPSPSPRRPPSPPLISLPVDVRRDQGEYIVQADLPGIQRSDIDLSVQRGRLTLIASRPAPSADGGERLRSERAHGRMERSLALPADVDEDAVSARLEDGVLTVRLPRLLRRDKHENPIIM